MRDADITQALATVNARYASCLDSDRLEDWPSFFTDEATYKVTTRDNFNDGLAGALIYATSKGMIEDRVQALRRANIYERQSYRHLLGYPDLVSIDESRLKVETSFAVIRTMRTGQIDLFASGVYIDQVVDTEFGWRFRERIAVCDSSRIDTLLAIPV